MALSSVQRRDLRLLATFRGLSFLGDAIALVALYLRVAHSGEGWMIAALSIAGALPLVALAPVAGYVVDRVPAKSFLAALCGAEAVICAAIGLWHGNLVTIALLALLACGVAFSLPGYSALVPTLAGEENVALGQSMTQSVQGAAFAAGPALGGILVGVLGQSWPLYLDAVSFALAGVGTMRLRSDRRPRASRAITTTKHQSSAGFRLMLHDPLLRPVVVTVTIILLTIGAINVVEVFFITRTLHASAFFYGLVGASFGLGTMIGSLASRRLRQEPHRLVVTTLVNIFLVGVLLGSIGLVTHVGYVFALMVLAGVTVGIINVAYSTLFVLQTPEALRGRLFAATGALFTAAEIGSTVLGGILLTFLSPRTIYLLFGAVSALAVGVVAPLELRTSRRTQRRAQGD